MAREPFAAGSSDDETGSGPTAYTGNPDVRRPALGRSSRDIAADVGPGGATEEAFTAAPGSELRTGDADGPRVNPDAPVGLRRPPGTETSRPPEIDPDTRLGLHPSIAPGTVLTTPADAVYTTDPLATRAVTGMSAGIAAAVPVVMIAYTIFWINGNYLPSYITASRALIGIHSPLMDHLIGTFTGLSSAAAWGALFGLIVRRPTLAKGLLFGILPTLCFWLVIAPLSGQRLAMGFDATHMLLPLALNTLVWGVIIGHLCGRWLRPSYE